MNREDVSGLVGRRADLDAAAVGHVEPLVSQSLRRLFAPYGSRAVSTTLPSEWLYKIADSAR